LKRGLALRADELGIYICGGRGRFSRNTPQELRLIAERRGFDGEDLVRTSRLTARVDNNAIGDGFQIYLHCFVLTAKGEWAIVQQGLNDQSGLARRYHWHSPSVRDFVAEPHTGIVGENQGTIMNLVDVRARSAQTAMLDISHEHPEKTLSEARRLFTPTGVQSTAFRRAVETENQATAGSDASLREKTVRRSVKTDNEAGVQSTAFRRRLAMPGHHDVRPENINLKRLGAVLAVAYERDLHDFAELLLLENLGPRTLQSLALISEVVHGAPSRFSDPARFSFALGGKDRHPFPVPLKTYDESLNFLRTSLDAARLGDKDKLDGFRRLDRFVRGIETRFDPEADFKAVIAHEEAISPSLDGRSVFDDKPAPPIQPSLF
jgi:hypothetical protein